MLCMWKVTSGDQEAGGKQGEPIANSNIYTLQGAFNMLQTMSELCTCMRYNRL